MSIVGTRPPLIGEVSEYELHHRARLAIKPGITGMWQVSGRSDITDFEEVVELDKEYSPELKDALLRRMLPLNNESITKISREEGISEQTLRNWRDKARREGYAAPGTDAIPDNWSTQDKFLIVVETASMNETELAEYARKKGLYVEQIKAWKDACMNANGGVAKEASRLNRELKDFEKERRKLEKELQRKEKALAEAEALLVLSKKANAIWGESEDE